MELFYFCEIMPAMECELEHLQLAVYDRLEGKINTDFDSLTHFLLCLLAINYPMLENTIFRVEIEIAKRRLLNIDAKRLRNYFINVCRDIQTVMEQNRFCGRNRQRLELSLKILEVIEKRVDHVFFPNHLETCRHSKLIIPFMFPLALVSQRKVEISLGNAEVHCGLWPELIIDLYSHLLSIKIKCCPHLKKAAEVSNSCEDDRIRRILQNCAARLGVNTNTTKADIALDNIDSESKFFPPCMASLHQCLRKSHRLSYDSRYQYSLFLKDAGLRIEDNISFWMQEYNKPQINATCTHAWDEKKNRYIYQLKHMYGLVAGTHAKDSRPCQIFIDSISSKMNSGCPFQHFSANDLIACIPLPLKDSASAILEYQASDEPRRACAHYLRLQTGLPGPNEIERPIQYYNLAKRYPSGCNLCFELEMIDEFDVKIDRFALSEVAASGVTEEAGVKLIISPL